MTPEPKMKGKTDEERWALGSSLDPDEQRYVLERFPESRRTLGLTESEWLAQTSFRLNRSGTLDLRAITCRLPLVAGEEPRFHRVPRGKEWPTPTPPKRRQGRREPQLPPGVRPIVEGALATGDLAKANEALHRLSGGKTVRQVAEEWAAKIETPPADPPQREQQQPQPDPPPPAEGQTYRQRVYQAYRNLAEQYQCPDVRIDALHGRLGGSLQGLHRWLRQACRDHLAVPSTGEPAFAGDAARQSALTLPGETDRATGKPQPFLLIKLIDPPMTQDQQPQQQDPTEGMSREDRQRWLESTNPRDHPWRSQEAIAEELAKEAEQDRRDQLQQQERVSVTLTREDLLEAQQQQPEPNTFSIEHLVATCEMYGRDFTTEDARDRFNEACRELKQHDQAAFAEWLSSDAYSPRRFYLLERSPEQQARRYEALLRETAELRYPERTAELEARIEATIQRKVGEFNQERQAAREHQQAQASYQVRQEQTGIVVASYPTLKQASDRACRWEEDLSIWMRRRDGTCREMAPQEVTEMLTAQKRREVAQQRRQQQQQQAQPPPQARSQEQGRDMER